MKSSSSPHGVLERATADTANRLGSMARAGRAVRIGPAWYAVGASLPAEDLARRYVLEIAGATWPGGVVCGLSGLAGGSVVGSDLYIDRGAGGRPSQLSLTGVTIKPVDGPGPLSGDIPITNTLHVSGPARQLVENVNLAGRRPEWRAGTAAVEDKIDDLARNGGPGRLQDVLGELDQIAGYFDERQVDIVRQRLVAVLGSGTVEPESPRLAARLSGEAYDAHRIELLENVVAEVERNSPRPRVITRGERWSWLPFFEAYFSNFIEGTEFGVDEARRIAIDGEVPDARPEDAHDVAATYRLASRPEDAATIPTAPDGLIELLRQRHAQLMAGRPNLRPGEFKDRPNFAGGYRFVDPDLVEGTLRRGFDLVNRLADPLHRAVGMMALITEVHPFLDGNGRIARLFANAELSYASQARIVIPTGFRNDYLRALSGMSTGGPGASAAILSVLDFAQKWVVAVDWSDYEEAKHILEATNAFADPVTAEPHGIHLHLPT